MLSRKGEAAVTVEAGFMVVEVFTVRAVSEVSMVEVFTVRAVSEVFMAEAFMVGAGLEVFIGAILDTFTAVDSRGFMAMAVSLDVIVFSVPASMDTRDGGVGVIPIRIGVTRTTPITRTTLTIRISRSRRVARRIFLASLRRFLRRDSN
jgi:hypothetical protein